MTARLPKIGWKAGLVLLLGVILSGAGLVTLARSERRLLGERFRLVAQPRIDLIRAETEAHLREEAAAVRFFRGSVSVSAAEFSTFVEPVLARHPGVRAFEWAVRDGAGYRVAYHVPRALHAVGWRLDSAPALVATIAEARDRGVMRASAAVVPRWVPGRRPLVLVLTPVYEQGAPLDTVEARRGALVGFVVVALDVAATVEGVFAGLAPSGVEVLVDDLSAPAGEQRVYGGPRGARSASSAVASGDTGSSIVREAVVNVAGRRWRIRCTPTKAFLAAHRSPWPWVVPGLGLAFALLAGGWLRQLEQRAAFVEGEVAERTVALRESEERLALALEGAALGLWDWDVVRGHLTRNQRWAEMLGHDPDEVAPTKEWWEGVVHPDDIDRVERALEAHLAGESEAYEAEYRMRTRSGEWIWVLDRGRVVERDREGRALRAAGTHLDVTDRRRAEEALRFTQFAVDHVSEAAYWMTPDGRFIYVNQASCETLGYRREELLGMTVFDISPAFPRDAWPAHWAELKQQGSLLFEAEHGRKDGTVFPVEISANFVEFGGQEYNCAFARDLSDRKRSEAERREIEAQLRHGQKLESLGILAGGIAHDFNNLLTGILGYADLALHELAPASPARESVQEIVTGALHAADLAKQMLAYSGKGKFVVEALSINQLVRGMTHLLEVGVSKKALLRFELAEGLPAIEGDPTQIRQVVMNLVINASEAIGERSGVISISTGAVDCGRDYLRTSYVEEDQPEGLYVSLEVADTGCGMDAATRDRVFDPFFSTKFTGRGLGMAAVLGIVRGHGGAIKVYSEPGRGTTVKVLFPAMEGASVAAADATEAGVEREAWRGSGTVLVADDDETVRALASTMLEALGFEVLTAADGRQALELFREHRDAVDCVLLDLTMPHMDGEEAFRELRLVRPDVKVILSSGYNEQEVTQRFAGKGLAGFIQKPYRVEALAEELRRVLGD